MGAYDQYKYRHLLTKCPICNKAYDEYWKIVSHIRKAHDNDHQDYLKQQESQFVKIYLSSKRQQLHDNLAQAGNIFAGVSFANTITIIRKQFNSEELEIIRKERISATLSNVPKTAQHNQRVSHAVTQAWKDGKFDTEECKIARQKGYAKRRSYSGKGNPMYGKPSPKGAGRGKGGIRKDIGHYVRSRWEANICRICLYFGRKYEFEKYRFQVTVNGIEYTYCPDLYFPDKKLHYEIKGHARSSSAWLCECKTCIKNKLIMPAVVREYKIKLIIIGKYEYMRMKRLFKSRIPNWEK